ncbi:MAG: hypothetical protein ACK4M4_05660 [Flavobacterium sp.]
MIKLPAISLLKELIINGKKTSFDKLKDQLEQDLGLVFVNQNKDRIRYTITNH